MMRRTLSIVLACAAVSVLAGVCSVSAMAAQLRVGSSDGVKLAVTTYGGSRAMSAVIVIHGGPGSSPIYLGPLPRSLSSSSVLSAVFAERGVDPSTAPSDSRYSMEAYVQDIDAIRRALGVDRVTLVGHSFGGFVAQAYAVSRPDHVAGLALLDAEPANFKIDEAGQNDANRRTAQLQSEGLIPKTLPANVGNSCTSSARATVPAYIGNPRERIPAYARDIRCFVQAQDDTFASYYNAATFAQVAHGLLRVTLPVINVFGSNDLFGRAWDMGASDLLQHNHPRNIEIMGAGHEAWVDHLPEVSAPLRAFIAHVQATRCGRHDALCKPHVK